MNDGNYARTITVRATADAAYRALTAGHEAWWTVCDGRFDEVGDRVRFTFPPLVSYWTFAATALVPNLSVELECVDAYHRMTDKPDAPTAEWLGSSVQWRVEPRGDWTDIHLVHAGLTPDLHCYDVCEAGWDLFFADSLKAYLDTGVGKPFQSERSS